MSHYTGVIFAFVALICWGFGDFFIQKTTRLVGSWKTLFFICIVGMVGLFPFIKDDLLFLGTADLWMLGLVAVVMIFAAFFDFEALKRGKIAIIEPIMGIELPITVALSITLGLETLTGLQIILVSAVFIGIVLAITEHHTHLHYHRRIFEKGVILAGVGAIAMALTNFLVGVSSQEISPLVTIWFAHSFLAIVSGLFLLYRGEFVALFSDLRSHPGPIIGQSILDNLAWIAFALATTHIPISIAITISESYIALAVLLGLFVNREKLKFHQIIGVVFAIIGVITLSYFS